MGVVYHAHDTQLEHDVAIKVLPDEVAEDKMAVKNLKEEARILLKLTHRNIVRLYDFKELGDCCCLVMEFVSGGSLTDVLAGHVGGIPEEKAIGYMIEVCRGLEDAHSQSVLHRDLKPSNILVGPSGEVKVADFGIARVLRDSYTRITGKVTSGTLVYMSPEQISGADRDSRSDIYSLGITFYELLSSRVPFFSGDITYQHLHVRPNRIDGISDWLWTLLERMLEKKPEDRPQSVRGVREALDAGRVEPALQSRVRIEEEAGIAGVPKESRPASRGLMTCPDCGSEVSETAPECIRCGRPLKESEVNEKIVPAGWFCFLAALLLRFLSFGAFKMYSLLFIAAAAAGIYGISRKKIVAGVPLLVATMIIPPICWFGIAAFKVGKSIKNSAQTGSQNQMKKVETNQSSAAGNETQGRTSGGDAAKGTANLPSRGDTYVDPVTGMEFIWIADDCFMMGSKRGKPDERPVHEVCVDGFWIGMHEVTNLQYRRYQPDHGSALTSEERKNWSDDFLKKYSLNSGIQPVVYVSWQGAVEYADWLRKGTGRHYRLPTEAEWEYAARAGSVGERYWGDDPHQACLYGNVSDDTYRKRGREPGTAAASHDCDDGYVLTAPVGSFKPNGFGLYDMLGNVSEMCLDWYDGDYYARSTRDNPGVPLSAGIHLKIIRGGSFSSPPEDVRSAVRLRIPPGSRGNLGLGFRLVMQQ